MNKLQVARALEEIAHYLELSEPNRFKAMAFERAARHIEALDADIVDLVRSGDLYKMPGIGKSIGPIVTEIVETGTSRYLEELRQRFPAGIFELLRVPHLGLKKIGILHEALGIASLDDLEAACRAGKLTALRGFGPKTQQTILDGIERARRNESKFLLPVGLEVGELVRERLAAIDEIEDAEIAGAVRRRLEIVTSVEIVVSTRAPEKVIQAIRRRGLLDAIEVDGDTVRGTIRNEMEVVLHLAAPAEFGSRLLVATGSDDFLDAFRKRAEIPSRARTEEEAFAKAGLAFVEPERRENGDDLARKRRRRLIEPADLRGTFHVHTTFSDGRNTVLEMLDAARARDFEYVGISDHSKAAYYAGGLSEDGLRLQQAEIEKQRKAVAPLRVFKGTEADILADGTIDYDLDTLAAFDFVVASVHSRFGMEKDEMTERILTALDNPYVTFLGHLTGRLLLARDGYTVDFDRVFDKAAERGVMIEINGNPRRLDVDWRHIRNALTRGVRFCINPDAHSIAEYGAVITGTWVARKGGLSAREVFNTLPADEVEAFFAAKKSGAARG